MSRIGDAWRVLVGRETKASAVGGLGMSVGLGQPVRMSDSYADFAKDGYGANVVVRKCIETIGRCAGSVTLQTMRSDEEAPDSPLARLLSRPNPWESGASFLAAAMSYRLLAGETFLEQVDVQGLPGELYALRPDRFEVLPGATGTPAAYVYKLGGAQKRFEVDSLTGRSSILHWRCFNPETQWRGRSPLSSCSISVDQHNASGEWNLSLLQNGARPPGFLNLKTQANLRPDQEADLRKHIADRMTGPKNAGPPALLTGEWGWTSTGLGPAEMEWLQGHYAAAREICMALNFPALLLGIPGDNKYANMAEARIELWEDSVLPLLDSFLDVVNQHLAQRFGPEWRVQYDPDSILALAPRRAEKMKALQGITYLTDNEKRIEAGWDAYDPDAAAGPADRLYQSATMLPLGFEMPTAAMLPADVPTPKHLAEWLEEKGYKPEAAARILRVVSGGS